MIDKSSNLGSTLRMPWRFLAALAALIVGLIVVAWSIDLMRDQTAPRLVIMGVALVVGVLGVWGLYWINNYLVSLIPSEKIRSKLQPYVFLAPALILLVVFLLYPALRTMYLSLFDDRSQNFVGLENYEFAFTEPSIQIAFRNNALWLVNVTGFSVVIGLVFAFLVDRVKYEAVAKSLIFLPLAISFVGASVIWRFIYAFAPPGRPQVGLLNAIKVALGGDPVGWFIEKSINNYALIVIMIWLQTGFAMVILSAAIKGVPPETIEAARIDGAGAFQVFLRVIIPQIRGTIITVATTILIAVLKVFDVVFVMTSGQFDTEVIANRMYAEMFRFRNFGHGSALAVILLVAVIPVMVINIRNLRRERSLR
jgi:alpha-glucoside transport system permease protein